MASGSSLARIPSLLTKTGSLPCPNFWRKKHKAQGDFAPTTLAWSSCFPFPKLCPSAQALSHPLLPFLSLGGSLKQPGGEPWG